MFPNANVNRDTPPYVHRELTTDNSAVCDALSYLKVPQNFFLCNGCETGPTIYRQFIHWVVYPKRELGAYVS